ncbi:unnamed protein product [Caenorhabditis sp. 36 PRJEB53466]|nr:unnamed protein product [Caenorhabditis sp. 36 PRJEB53466]
MTKSHAPPSRSSERAGKPFEPYQVVHAPGKKRNQNSDKREKTVKSKHRGKSSTPQKVKKIIGHNVFLVHYVEYECKLKDGTKTKLTEFELRKYKNMLEEYKEKVTGQTDSSDTDYAVEKILAHRMVNKKPLYLVQWRGFPNPVSHSEMWETDLENCKVLLEAYKQAHPMLVHTAAKTTSTKQRGRPSSSSKRGRPLKKDSQVSSSDEDSDQQEDEEEEKVSKKKQKTSKKAESSDDEEKEENVSKKKQKKSEKAESSDDEDDEPATKKIKKTSKVTPKRTKRAASSSDESYDDDDDDESQVKKKKSTPKGKPERKSRIEDSDDGEEEDSGDEKDEGSDDEEDEVGPSSSNGKNKQGSRR